MRESGTAMVGPLLLHNCTCCGLLLAHIIVGGDVAAQSPSFSTFLPFSTPLFVLTGPHSSGPAVCCACPCHLFGQPLFGATGPLFVPPPLRHRSFTLAATNWSSCSLPAFLLISIRLPVPILEFGFRLCSLGAHFGFICGIVCAHFQLSFGLVWACP